MLGEFTYTRTFGDKVDHETNDERWNGGGSKHEAPVPVRWRGICLIVSDLFKCNGDNETKHDSECRPHLPHHRECSTNRRRSTFSRVYRSRARFRTHCQAEGKASNEEIIPRICGRHPDALNNSATFVTEWTWELTDTKDITHEIQMQPRLPK